MMADAQDLIFIAVGPDQVGLVRKISEFIVRSGGNIEDSRMAVLAGEFAQIVHISGEPGSLSAIVRDSARLGEDTGLTIWTKQPPGKKAPEPSLPYQLVASCMDHPGVVHRLSTVLSKHGINIESMETKTYAAPVTGAPIFRLEAVITIPARVKINTLRSVLEVMEREENINIELSLLTSPSAGPK